VESVGGENWGGTCEGNVGGKNGVERVGGVNWGGTCEGNVGGRKWSGTCGWGKLGWNL
jgi:hypothetical protein